MPEPSQDPLQPLIQRWLRSDDPDEELEGDPEGDAGAPSDG